VSSSKARLGIRSLASPSTKRDSSPFYFARVWTRFFTAYYAKSSCKTMLRSSRFGPLIKWRMSACILSKSFWLTNRINRHMLFKRLVHKYFMFQYPGLPPIDAKQSYSLPIEAVMRNRIKIRPDGMEIVLCESAFAHLVSWFRFWMEHGKLQLDRFHSAIEPYSNLSLSRGR
jgi:hypothetical protein